MELERSGLLIPGKRKEAENIVDHSYGDEGIAARMLRDAGLLVGPEDLPQKFTQWFHALADALDRAERAEAEVAKLRAVLVKSTSKQRVGSDR